MSKNDEPRPEGDDWIEWGGELIWPVAGYTSGGAPIGFTVKEFREMNQRDDQRKGWTLAKDALHLAFVEAAEPDARLEIGWVKQLGEGLFRRAFVADVDVFPDPRSLSGRYVALVPSSDGNPCFVEQARHERRVLDVLSGCDLPFGIPLVVALVDGPALVEKFVPGIPLDLRAGRQGRVRPWKVVGHIAAAVHRVGAVGLRADPHTFVTRQAHADSMLEIFDGLDTDPIVRDARAWLAEHRPPATPSALLHGDLLGQNILLGAVAPGDDDRPCVIDWTESLFGDPAYDLAIVTRGVRRPFQLEGGLQKLLDAYQEAGGQEITPAEIHFHEMCFAASWYRNSLDESTRIHAPEVELNRLRGIMRRAMATT